MDIKLINKEKGNIIVTTKLSPREYANLIVELDYILEDKKLKKTVKLLEGLKREFLKYFVNPYLPKDKE